MISRYEMKIEKLENRIEILYDMIEKMEADDTDPNKEENLEKFYARVEGLEAELEECEYTLETLVDNINAYAY